MATSYARLSVETLAVCCPHCGEPFPAPDNGADPWTPQQVREACGKALVCVACDESFRVHAEGKIAMPPRHNNGE